MKKYYNKDEAPLAFHKFFWYVSLPIGFLVSAGRMISEVSEMQAFNWVYAVDIGYYIIALALMLACFIGFFGWKAYAWYGVIIYLCLGVLYNSLAVIVYALYIPDQIGTAVGQLLGILIFAVLLGIYYRKRKPLFFTDTLQVVPETNQNLISQESSTSDTPPQIKFCRKCGYELLPKSAFCSKCGTQIIADNEPVPDNNKSVRSLQDAGNNSADVILWSSEFDEAYLSLSADQKEKFFLPPDRRLDAARVMHSMLKLVGPVDTMTRLFEIYITIFARLIVTHMSPERIAVTLNMRYADILNADQRYLLVAFTEAHINGMNQGFYIKSDSDIEKINAIAKKCQEAAGAEKGVASSPDYGYSQDNPIRVQSIPAEYSYIDRLLYDNGTIVKRERIASVDNSSGDMLDYFILTVNENAQEKTIELYIDGYGESPSLIAPQGFHLK